MYTAINNETGDIMAMKEIPLQPNDHKTLRNVADELRIFESIHHKHLINHYGVEVHREEMLIFMEYCPEGTLEELVSTTEMGLEETSIRRYARQLLEAVAVLHEHGVVHRDIKGANIFLTDDMQNLKLGDFGCAVKIKAHTTMPGELQGFVGTQGIKKETTVEYWVCISTELRRSSIFLGEVGLHFGVRSGESLHFLQILQYFVDARELTHVYVEALGIGDLFWRRNILTFPLLVKKALCPTCGTRQQSASVTSSPTQYLPLLLLTMASTALSPFSMKKWLHSLLPSSVSLALFITARFCGACVPALITSAISLALALKARSEGRSAVPWPW